MTSLSAVRRDSTRPVPASTTTSSVVTDPLTTDSPRPHAALITVWSRRVGRIGGEHHPGRLGVDHLLDHDGEAHRVRVDAFTGAVGHGTRCPQGGPALNHGRGHSLRPPDVAVGFLLPGEAG